MRNYIARQNLATFLKRAREEKGMNQREFADWLNVETHSIQKWESSRSLPDFISTIRLIKYYPELGEMFYES